MAKLPKDERPLGEVPATAWHVTRETVDLVRRPAPARPITIHDRDRALTLDLSRSALVVIDMQNDFCHPDGWLGHIGVDTAPARAPIEQLKISLPKLRAAKVPVIWLNWGNRADRMNLPPAVLHVYDPDGQSTGIGKPLPGSGAHVLEKDSWSAAVVDELAPVEGDICIDKFRMSGFQDTELDSVLRNLGVTTVLFGGVNADQCVMCTLQDANFRGYDVIMLEDISATTSPEYCMQATLYNVRQCFGFVSTLSDLTSDL